MLHGAKLKTALSKVKLISAQGPWWRAVGHHHTLAPPPGLTGKPQAIWGGSSAIAGARFTPRGGFDSVYLAGDLMTAFVEVQAVALVPGGTVTLQAAPWTLVTVKGTVTRVLDLTHAGTRSALGTNKREMTGAWLRAKKRPTQELARAAYDSGKIAGIKYDSAKHPGGVNLVVFPDRLVASSTDYLEVFDPNGHLAQRIGA